MVFSLLNLTVQPQNPTPAMSEMKMGISDFILCSTIIYERKSD